MAWRHNTGRDQYFDEDESQDGFDDSMNGHTDSDIENDEEEQPQTVDMMSAGMPVPPPGSPQFSPVFEQSPPPFFPHQQAIPPMQNPASPDTPQAIVLDQSSPLPSGSDYVFDSSMPTLQDMILSSSGSDSVFGSPSQQPVRQHTPTQTSRQRFRNISPYHVPVSQPPAGMHWPVRHWGNVPRRPSFLPIAGALGSTTFANIPPRLPNSLPLTLGQHQVPRHTQSMGGVAFPSLNAAGRPTLRQPTTWTRQPFRPLAPLSIQIPHVDPNAIPFVSQGAQDIRPQNPSYVWPPPINTNTQQPLLQYPEVSSSSEPQPPVAYIWPNQPPQNPEISSSDNPNVWPDFPTPIDAPLQQEQLTSSAQFRYTGQRSSNYPPNAWRDRHRDNILLTPENVAIFVMYFNRHVEALLSLITLQEANQPSQVFLRNYDIPEAEYIYQINTSYVEAANQLGPDTPVKCRICGREFVNASFGKIHEVTCIGWVYRFEERQFGLSSTMYQQAFRVEPLTIHNLEAVFNAGRIGQRVIIQENPQPIVDLRAITAPVWIYLDINYDDAFAARARPVQFRCMNAYSCHDDNILMRRAPLNSMVDFLNHMFVYHLCCDKCGDLSISYRNEAEIRVIHNLNNHVVQVRFGNDTSSIIFNPQNLPN